MSRTLDDTPLLDQIESQDISDGVQNEQRISMTRAVLVLINSIIGVGLLSVAYCYRSGIVLNTMLSLILASCASISFYFLIDSSERTRVYDYSKLIVPSFGEKYEWIPNTILAVVLFGVGILYMQFGYSLLCAFLRYFDNIPDWVFNRWLIIFMPILFINIPLSCLRSIQKLSLVSFCSMFLVFIYLIHNIFYFIRSVNKYGFDPQNEINYVTFNKFFIPSIAIQATSYSCHQNIFPALNKLENGTKQRKMTVMIIVAIIAFLIYTTGGLFGYITLFDKIDDPVSISWYPEGQIFTFITQGLYSILLCLTIPLLYWASRLSINDLVFKSEFTTLRWNFIGISLLLVGGLIAVTVKKIVVVFSFIGGICSPLIVYILPTLYFLRINKERSKIATFIAYCLLVIGFASITICLYDRISSMV
jgi:amino acid permease